jgi:hypothetical protein
MTAHSTVHSKMGVYAQVQLVGATSVQTMLHNTVWACVNVNIVPKFQNDQSVDNNVLSNQCKRLSTRTQIHMR